MHLLPLSLSALERVLPLTKAYAKQHNADLAIPNCQDSGVGNALVFTRLVEDWARVAGRPVNIITAPLCPSVGCVKGEDPFALWLHNPYVGSILNAEKVDLEGFGVVDMERRSLIQVNHVIENICFAYGLRPRHLRPSLFLSKAEMRWALDQTGHLPRPLICLHPGGTSSSGEGAPWHHTRWQALMTALKNEASFFQVGRSEFGDQDLGLLNPGRTLREAMALIWAADVFIGFDSSPMSIATAFEKPVIALFDMTQKFQAELRYGETHVPSVILRWAYPQNRNIALMDNDDGDAAMAYIIDGVRSYLDQLTYRI